MTVATPGKPASETAVVLLYTLAIVLLVLSLGFGLFVLPVFVDILAGMGRELSRLGKLGSIISQPISWALPLVFLRGAYADLRDRRSGKSDGKPMLAVCVILGTFLLLVLAVAIDIVLVINRFAPD